MHATTLAIEVLLPDEPLTVDLPHVYAQLHRLPDQRARRCVRYPRPMLLVVAILAKLAGLHQVQALEHLLQQSLHPSNPEVPNRAQIALALDGKTLRGTIPLGHTQGVHLVAAYVPEHSVTLTQVQVATKENEITVAPTILPHLDLTGWRHASGLAAHDNTKGRSS